MEYFGRAKTAKEQYMNSQEDERIGIANLEYQVNYNTRDAKDEEIDSLKARISELEQNAAAFPTMTFVKETSTLYSTGASTATENFTLDKGKYLLVPYAHAREYGSILSVTSSQCTVELIKSSGVSLWDNSTARGAGTCYIYKTEVTEDNTTLTFGITNSSNTSSYASIGKCMVFSID